MTLPRGSGAGPWGNSQTMGSRWKRRQRTARLGGVWGPGGLHTFIPCAHPRRKNTFASPVMSRPRSEPVVRRQVLRTHLAAGVCTAADWEFQAEGGWLAPHPLPRLTWPAAHPRRLSAPLSPGLSPAGASRTCRPSPSPALLSLPETQPPAHGAQSLFRLPDFLLDLGGLRCGARLELLPSSLSCF